MNTVELYDKSKAAQELEKIAQEQLNSGHTQVHIAQLMKTPGWPENYIPSADGPVWRLACVTSDGETPQMAEETVLTFQGVIYNRDLPPFKEKPTDKHNQARYIRQTVTIGGLDTPTFAKVVDNIAEIHAVFGRAMGLNSIEECAMVGEEDGEKVLYAANRYFTPKRDAANRGSVLLTADIDPHGYLARIGGENYAYTEDNHVYYFERRKEAQSQEYSFVPCQPIKFRVGDIVEVQVSFVLLTMREGKMKTAMVLRSLLLLDGAITHKSMVDRITKRGPAKTGNVLKRRVGYEGETASKTKMRTSAGGEPSMKRKVGYIEEEVSYTSQKMSKMEIDEAGEEEDSDAKLD